jgi:hypothetical protein
VSDDADSDELGVSDLVLTPGGQWSGLLFDNPALGLRPWLSWSFTFPFADVSRDYGSSPVSLAIEWVLIDTASWRDMAGHTARSPRFADTTEASVYFFEHHRYESVDLHILDQRDLGIQVAAQVSGDLDGLGIDSVAVDGWLTFTGIHVSLSTARSAEEAKTRLQDFTDATGLFPSPGVAAGIFLFAPNRPAASTNDQEPGLHFR